MKSLRRLVCVLLLGGVFMSQVASAGPYFRIPVSPEPPWVVEEGNQLRGIDIRIIERVAKAAGFRYELITCPWARCLKIMEEGNADFMIGLFRRPERERYLRFIEPGYLQDDPKTFYLHPQRSVRIDRYEDLYPLTIGVLRGAAYFDRFDQDARLKKVVVNQDTQLIEMLLLGRLDTFIGTPSDIDYQMHRRFRGKALKTAHYQYPGEAWSYMALSRKSPYVGEAERLGQIIRKLRDAGEFTRIKSAYLKAPCSDTPQAPCPPE